MSAEDTDIKLTEVRLVDALDVAIEVLGGSQHRKAREALVWLEAIRDHDYIACVVGGDEFGSLPGLIENIVLNPEEEG